MLKGYQSGILLIFMLVSTLANAVHINHDRKGQVALLPYYTVNNNFISNFTVTNTTSLFKAVRVRIVDSRIAADLLNINLYLSPFDVWNGTLRKDPISGLPNLITEDETCTYPDKSELQAGIEFQNHYVATTDDDLTEGFIEIIEMGDIADGIWDAEDGGNEAEIDTDGVADGVISSGDRSIKMGLLHDVTGMPADCSVVTDAWEAGDADSDNINGFESGSMSAEGIAEDGGGSALPYDNSHNAGLVAPSGGINAYGIMIDVANGKAFVQEATHIDRYSTVAQHYLPDDPVHYRLPSLASGDVREAYITNALGEGVKGDIMPLTEYDTGALQDISPRPSVPMGSNPLPIAAVLSAESISTPYFVESNLNGATDVVMTFPMRKHSIFNSGTLTNQADPERQACAGSLNDGIDDGQAVFLSSLNAVVQDYPHNANGSLCENSGFEVSFDSWGDVIGDTRMKVFYYDYEEATGVMVIREELIYSPMPVDAVIKAFQLMQERSVNVNQVVPANEESSSLFGTSSVNGVPLNLDAGFASGWMTFDFYSIYNYETSQGMGVLTEPAGGLGSDVNNSWSGVPVIGFTAISSEIQSNSVGETVEFIRSVNRD